MLRVQGDRCLDGEAIAAFVAGELDPASVDVVDCHLDACEACLDRVSARAVLLRSDLLEARGLLSQMVGEPAQAIEAHGAALELRLEYLGRSSYEVSKSLQNLATARGQAGDVDHALTTMEQALHARVDALGPRHPKVADVAVFGVPSDEMGEEVKAVVQPMPGVEKGPELEAELIHFCQDNLAKQKCPRSIDFDDELPRLPTGKLYKRQLRDRYWGDKSTRIV